MGASGMIRNIALACLTAAAVAGCMPPPLVQQPTTARPEPRPAAAVANGSIYLAATNYQPLFEDRRARNVGDTLVININENTAAKKDSDTTASKTGSVQTSVPTVTGLPVVQNLRGIELQGSSSNTFEGKGASTANNVFTGILTVTVIEVLSNGNLRVSGEKQLGINQGVEYIRLSGVVSPANIVANSVSSTQVADARIEYRADGFIDAAQVMGWLARFFLAVLPL